MIEWFGTETGRKILARFGLEKTLYHFCEECSELYAEVCHYDIRSDRNSDNVKVQEEIADVLILIDDLWFYIGDDVHPLYTRFASKMTTGYVNPKVCSIDLLSKLTTCIYYVTKALYFEDTRIEALEDLFDLDIYGCIARMIWYLEQYKKFHEKGFDEVYKRKLQKRALRLNVSVQA